MDEEGPLGRDGLPDDIENFVAVGPVPKGKRCLAVTHQSSGLSGVGLYNSPFPFVLEKEKKVFIL